MIEVPGVGGRLAQPLPRQLVASITEPRMEEIFRAVGRVLQDSGYRDLLGAGVVLCGGASLLEGTPELAEQVLGLPTRRGEPTGVGGLVEMVRSPTMATAVGLLKWGASRPEKAIVRAVSERSDRPGPMAAERDARKPRARAPGQALRLHF
jgi:cell division protein FtsA